jgi:hypothetical protein
VDVDACKISRDKTHDCHVKFQKVLPLIVCNILTQDVGWGFFNSICSKELAVQELDNMSILIREIICRLEMTFPPVFFHIMMHFPVHLAEEDKLGGPMCYRWMYQVERYLRMLKGYMRNKAHPEGSMAKGYLLEECLTICSHILEDINMKLSHLEHHESAAVNEPPSGLSVFGNIEYCKKGFTIETTDRF